MRHLFISHPLTDDPELRRKQIDKICKNIYKLERNVLPISPIHTFQFIERETPKLRQSIMRWCKSEIFYTHIHNIPYDGADVRFYEYMDKGLSNGQCKEYEYCLENEINIEIVKVDEYGKQRRFKVPRVRK